MDVVALATCVQTTQLKDSLADNFISGKIRAPSMEPGKYYMMREWNTRHHTNSDNPYTVVKFLGVGHVEGEYLPKNPSIKSMRDGQHYWFRAWDDANKRFYTFGAYMMDCCLCVASCAVRVTFGTLTVQPGEPVEDKAEQRRKRDNERKRLKRAQQRAARGQQGEEALAA